MQAILQDREGNLFVTFNKKDGLTHDRVRAVHGDADGNMWFGTSGGGVFRYGPSAAHADGSMLSAFTTADGLAHNSVRAIYGSADGVI